MMLRKAGFLQKLMADSYMREDKCKEYFAQLMGKHLGKCKSLSEDPTPDQLVCCLRSKQLLVHTSTTPCTTLYMLATNLLCAL